MERASMKQPGMWSTMLSWRMTEKLGDTSDARPVVDGTPFPASGPDGRDVKMASIGTA